MNKDLKHHLDIYNEILKSLDDLFEIYKKEGKEIVYLLNHKFQINDDNLFKSYFSSFLKDKPFIEYKKKLELEKDSKLKILEIEKKYYQYIRKYDILKDFIENKNFDSIRFNTIRELILKIEKENQKLLRLIVVDFDSEYNNFLINLNDLKKLIKGIKKKITIILNLSYQYKNYIRELDYSKLKKISFNKLETGDIILLDEYKSYKGSFVRREVASWIKSTILHSAIFYKKEKGYFLISQVGGFNRRKSFIGELEYEPGIRYIVLRFRKRLNEAEKNKIKKEIEKKINIKFSYFKLITIALNYSLTNFYRVWFPKISSPRNIRNSNKMYCAELVSSTLGSIERFINNYEDYSMMSPVDILNSFNLEVIGYFENEEK